MLYLPCLMISHQADVNNYVQNDESIVIKRYAANLTYTLHKGRPTFLFKKVILLLFRKIDAFNMFLNITVNFILKFAHRFKNSK